MRILDESWEKCILENKYRELGKEQEDEAIFYQINQQSSHPLALLLADTHDIEGLQNEVSPYIF